MPRTLLLWFKKDLRVHDHLGILKASKQCLDNRNTRVISIYCLDPREFHLTRWGHAKTGPFRCQFLYESLQDLQQNLQQQAYGNDLHVMVGKPEEKIPELCQQLGGNGGLIYSEEEITSEEKDVQERVRDALSEEWKLETHWSSTLYHKDDLPLASWSHLPDSFTPFRKMLEHAAVEPRRIEKIISPQHRPCLPLPENFQCEQQWSYLLSILEKNPKPPLPKVHQQVTCDFHGGETSALARMQHYIFDQDCLQKYHDTRNGMLGADYSTKFSPYLALGCLSPRRIYVAVKKYESERVVNKSTYWLIFELLWRDYFRFYFMKHHSRPFHRHGVVPRSDMVWGLNMDHFNAWTTGQTGWPLVDANMRELAATGFMSNRGRQNVASFLIHDLGLDWRLGADYMESLLLDYDVCSNWGNWHALAGLQGGRVNRFNITKQAHQYDPDGVYVRHWIPELQDVPTKYIHEPHHVPRQTASLFHFQIGQTYPRAIKTLPVAYSKKKNDNQHPRNAKKRHHHKGKQRMQ